MNIQEYPIVFFVVNLLKLNVHLVHCLEQLLDRTGKFPHICCEIDANRN